MQLPITRDQFFDLFAAYNGALWPALPKSGNTKPFFIGTAQLDWSIVGNVLGSRGFSSRPNGR